LFDRCSERGSALHFRRAIGNIVRFRVSHSVSTARDREHGSGLGRERWAVEQTISHLHNKRRLLIRTDRSHENARCTTQPRSLPALLPASSQLILLELLSAPLTHQGGKEAVVGAGGLRTMECARGRQSYLRANDSCRVAATERESRGTQTRSESRVASCERTRSVS
jgi:hypothetical protein